jgi:hypothetical protein
MVMRKLAWFSDQRRFTRLRFTGVAAYAKVMPPSAPRSGSTTMLMG